MTIQESIQPNVGTGPNWTVVVQRPGETPEEYERFIRVEQAAACIAMLERSEPTWKVWRA
ncbi:MAG: hypothetical protein R3D33_10725 [Hyphomicrobiaceae bacterium]